MLVGIRVAREGGGERLRFRAGIPNAIGQGGARLCDFVTEAAQFLVLRSLQPPDLLLHRAYAGHLPHIGGNSPEEQIARHIEGSGGQITLIGVRLHLLGAGQALAQGGKRQVLHLGVRGQQRLAGALIFRGGLAGEFGRSDESGGRKILIARRFRLPVPERFGLDLRSGQLADAFKTHDGVPQVGNGGVAVLKVKAFQEFFANCECVPIPWNREWNRETGCNEPGHMRSFRAAWARP